MIYKQLSPIIPSRPSLLLRVRVQKAKPLAQLKTQRITL